MSFVDTDDIVTVHIPDSLSRAMYEWRRFRMTAEEYIIRAIEYQVKADLTDAETSSMFVRTALQEYERYKEIKKLEGRIILRFYEPDVTMGNDVY